MTFQEAITLAKQGKEEGFRFLYSETSSKSYYIALKYTKNEDAAQDVLQDAYIKAFSNLDQLEDAAKFPMWFSRIVATKALDVMKKKTPVLFSEMETEEGIGAEEMFLEERAEFQPEVSLDRSETSRLVREMIDVLSDEQRMCILMFYMEQMSVKEIAETLNVSENTVKSRLNLGRQKIKEKVVQLEKKGTKLYGLGPVAFFLAMLSAEGKNVAIAYAASGTAATVSGLMAATSGAVSGTAALAGTAGAAVGTASGVAGFAGTAIGGIVVKALATIACISVVAVGAVHIAGNANKEPETPIEAESGTQAPESTIVPAPTSTPEPTQTPSLTNTPVLTPTNTPTPTLTNTPTPTPTNTPIPTPANTPTPTPTNTPIPTPTNTPIPTPTSTPTPVPILRVMGDVDPELVQKAEQAFTNIVNRMRADGVAGKKDIGIVLHPESVRADITFDNDTLDLLFAKNPENDIYTLRIDWNFTWVEGMSPLINGIDPAPYNKEILMAALRTFTETPEEVFFNIDMNCFSCLTLNGWTEAGDCYIMEGDTVFEEYIEYFLVKEIPQIESNRDMTYTLIGISADEMLLDCVIEYDSLLVSYTYHDNGNSSWVVNGYQTPEGVADYMCVKDESKIGPVCYPIIATGCSSYEEYKENWTRAQISNGATSVSVYDYDSYTANGYTYYWFEGIFRSETTIGDPDIVYVQIGENEYVLLYNVLFEESFDEFIENYFYIREVRKDS